MTDTPLRKTLSLKLKKPTETRSNLKSSTSHISNDHISNDHNNYPPKQRRNSQEREVVFSTQNNTSDHVAQLAKNNPLLQDLQKKRKGLLDQIKVLEQRLVFISSEPLQTACNELKKEDTAILCQINDYLIISYN